MPTSKVLRVGCSLTLRSPCLHLRAVRIGKLDSKSSAMNACSKFCDPDFKPLSPLLNAHICCLQPFLGVLLVSIRISPRHHIMNDGTQLLHNADLHHYLARQQH